MRATIITLTISVKMYRIITYKSKPLKKSTIILEEDSTSSDFSDNYIEEKPKKKQKKQKKKPDEVTYLIDGVEVSEEDLTIDERLDIESAALLNQDDFYTPLKPVDAFLEGGEEVAEKKKSGNGWKIGVIIGVTFLLLGGIGAAMFFLLL